MSRQDNFDTSEFMPSRTLQLQQLPPGLARMRNPPTKAQLWGNVPPGPWVSIVGTRKASAHGQESAFELARELASRGVGVLSGGALGIDSAAHAGALAGGGQTMIVAPVWFEVAYPKENSALFREILRRGGGYLSIASSTDKPLTPAFYRRNEALVALSNVVVLGECPLRSGAKNALSYARRLGLPRFVLPFPYNCSTAAGSCQEVVQLGAELIPNARPIFKRLATEGLFNNPRYDRWLTEFQNQNSTQTAIGVGAPEEPHSDESLPHTLGRVKEVEGRIVLEALREGCVTADAICQTTDLAPALVQHQILLLTLAGYIHEDSHGVLRAC